LKKSLTAADEDSPVAGVERQRDFEGFVIFEFGRSGA
jgi:hypothetical protein